MSHPIADKMLGTDLEKWLARAEAVLESMWNQSLQQIPDVRPLIVS